MTARLDPRTKLYMILVVSAVVMMSATTPFLWAVRILMTIVPIVLLITEKHYASAFRFLILYTSALVINFICLSEQSEGFLMAFHYPNVGEEYRKEACPVSLRGMSNR